MTSSKPREYAPWVRITGIVATVIVICVATGFLGRWQYHRYEVRNEALQEYNQGLTEDPKPLADLIAPDATDLDLSSQWREAVVVGRFDPDSTTVLRNRPVDSTPAWQYLAWFDTNDGRSMLVNIGWVPLPAIGTEPPPVPYPTDETTITVIVRAWEEDDGNRGAGATRINPEHVPAPTYDSVPAYGMLREVCSGGECEDVIVGEQTPLPSLSTGPHLSYAWQWWVLAALTPVGAFILIRREREDVEEDGALDGRAQDGRGPQDGVRERAVSPGGRSSRNGATVGATGGGSAATLVSAAGTEAPSPASAVMNSGNSAAATASSGAAGSDVPIAPRTSAAKASSASAGRKRRKRKLSDEEIEDAL